MHLNKKVLLLLSSLRMLDDNRNNVILSTVHNSHSDGVQSWYKNIITSTKVSPKLKGSIKLIEIVTFHRR